MSMETFVDLFVLIFTCVFLSGVYFVIARGEQIAKRMVARTFNSLDDQIVAGLFNGFWFLFWVISFFSVVGSPIELFR